MLSKSFQSAAYRELLARQAEDDKERQTKLEELRKKKLREEIVRKREEELVRKKEQLAREAREEQNKQAKLDAERAEKQRARRLEEELRKRPLSVSEARERREKAESNRNSIGLAKTRQSLPPASKSLSSKYSSLLASAPTKLETLPPARLDSTKGVQANARKASAPTVPESKSLSSLATQRAGTDSVVLAPKIKLDGQATPASKTGLSSSKVASSSSNSKAVKRHLPASAPDLQPLQKTKRDLRTIEEIQNDLHRQKGKDYTYLKTSAAKPPSSAAAQPRTAVSTPSSSAGKGKSSINPITRPSTLPSTRVKASAAATNPPRKRSRVDSYDSDDSFIARPTYSSKSHKHAFQQDDGLGGQSIWDIMNPGKRRDAYLARDIDSDEDMEANADDIRREEERAAKAAKREDERELQLLREKERRKAAKKKELARRPS